MPRILIAASGTGGHIFPALAVAESLPMNWEIDWLGVPERLENKILPKDYDLTTLPLGGLQGNFFKKIVQIFRLLLAVKSVIALIKGRGIQIVFTTGGYIAAPAILAAKYCGIKVILHESNVLPGRVTRYIGRFCDVVAIGFPSSLQYLSQCKTILTGTPIRKPFEISQPLPSWIPSGNGPLIVVIGGSQGAVGLNQMVRAVYSFLLGNGCRVVHLTGEKDFMSTSMRHPNLIVKGFTDDMPGLLQHSDLAISRAGSGTISELSISSTPAILVPYPFASDDHQSFNALYAAENGAAVIIHQGANQENTLIQALSRLLNKRLSENMNNEDLLNKMKKGMQNIAIKDSTEKVLNIILQTL
tara:strand:+ start:149 stop:1222 length:1074 start_codon:yes stop_codon:yes gene_type:complete